MAVFCLVWLLHSCLRSKRTYCIYIYIEIYLDQLLAIKTTPTLNKPVTPIAFQRKPLSSYCWRGGLAWKFNECTSTNENLESRRFFSTSAFVLYRYDSPTIHPPPPSTSCKGICRLYQRFMTVIEVSCWLSIANPYFLWVGSFLGWRGAVNLLNQMVCWYSTHRVGSRIAAGSLGV